MLGRKLHSGTFKTKQSRAGLVRVSFVLKVPLFNLRHSIVNKPRSIYQYSNMAPTLSGQTSIFGVVFFVSKFLLGIEGQKKHEKFAFLTRKPRTRARILIYLTWPILCHVTGSCKGPIA